MKKSLDDYLRKSLQELLKREWSSRKQGKYIACPSCGARFHIHCQGCKLELAIAEKRKQDEIRSGEQGEMVGRLDGLLVSNDTVIASSLPSV